MEKAILSIIILLLIGCANCSPKLNPITIDNSDTIKMDGVILVVTCKEIK